MLLVSTRKVWWLLHIRHLVRARGILVPSKQSAPLREPEPLQFHSPITYAVCSDAVAAQAVLRFHFVDRHASVDISLEHRFGNVFPASSKVLRDEPLPLFGSRFETGESFATCCQVVTKAERGRKGSKLRRAFRRGPPRERTRSHSRISLVRRSQVENPQAK
jgi:hypothetical protein